jgi:nitroimidazol reductase NimA-like FMN-containing flavoprotein (pyridoxamine 5'-phosphate oxidase superfamily)
MSRGTILGPTPMTSDTDPTAELDARYSEEGATPATWQEARQVLREAPTSWLTTIRPDGRPHVTPLLTVWEQEAPWFCTGADERKGRNLAVNPQCVLTTGGNGLGDGLDVVVEGDAERVVDEERLQRVAEAYVEKYGREWHFDVRDGVFVGPVGNRALVFRIAPTTVFAFRKGHYSQTRFRPR